MTIDELILIKALIEEFKLNLNDNECTNINCSAIQCKVSRIINREIELKMMNPVKPKGLDANMKIYGE